MKLHNPRGKTRTALEGNQNFNLPAARHELKIAIAEAHRQAQVACESGDMDIAEDFEHIADNLKKELK